MKFTVREGFVVHDTKVVTVKQQGKSVLQPQTNTYYEGNTAELDSASALEHLHKLEPADKEAEKFVASFILKTETSNAPLDHSAAISALADQISKLTEIVSQMATVNKVPAVS